MNWKNLIKKTRSLEILVMKINIFLFLQLNLKYTAIEVQTVHDIPTRKS